MNKTGVIKVFYAKLNTETGSVIPTSKSPYTFNSDKEDNLLIGDVVIIRYHSNGEPQLGVIWETNVPEEEILKFGDDAKSIVGRYVV